MSNARTLASLIDTNNKIQVPSGGIQFADATNANSVANQSNLIEQDGYEEGTWTPTMSSGSVTINTANYIKIGRQVYLQAYLIDITDSSTNANIFINDLPFTSSNPQRAIGSLMIRYTQIPSGIGIDNVININPYISTSSTQMSLYISLNTPSTTGYNWQPLQYDQLLGIDWDLLLNITYLTD